MVLCLFLSIVTRYNARMSMGARISSDNFTVVRISKWSLFIFQLNDGETNEEQQTFFFHLHSFPSPFPNLFPNIQNRVFFYIFILNFSRLPIDIVVHAYLCIPFTIFGLFSDVLKFVRRIRFE